MLYWVYEELEYSPERNVEIFYGLAKTEDDAKRFCERKNSILSSITEKKVDVYKYRGWMTHTLKDLNLLIKVF